MTSGPKGRKQKLKGGYEYDWESSWRQYYGWRGTTGKYVKKGMNKRERRDAKRELKDEGY